MRLRVEGGTGQALCVAVKQPTATSTNAGRSVGPELADRVLPLPTRWSLRAGDVKVRTGAPSVKRAGRVCNHECARRDCCLEFGGRGRRAVLLWRVWVTSPDMPGTEISSGFEWCYSIRYTQGARDTELSVDYQSTTSCPHHDGSSETRVQGEISGTRSRISQSGHDLYQGEITRALGSKQRISRGRGSRVTNGPRRRRFNLMEIVVAGLCGGRSNRQRNGRPLITHQEWKPRVVLVLRWC